MNPDTDLLIERDLAASPAAIWRCWTEPALLMRWFCPPPWRVTHAEIDPRPGGIFKTVMEGPNGEKMDGDPGCILLAEPERRLVWTDGNGPGFRPRADTFMVADMTFAPSPKGTLYRALVMHCSPEQRAQHEEMGFFDGWGTAIGQIEALAQSL